MLEGMVGLASIFVDVNKYFQLWFIAVGFWT
jgi:hypothetical protein